MLDEGRSKGTRGFCACVRGLLLNGVASLLARPPPRHCQVWMDGGHYAPLNSLQTSDDANDAERERVVKKLGPVVAVVGPRPGVNSVHPCTAHIKPSIHLSL